ncbi:MAG TPA: glycerophosphodiester phosphodiesterase, partial [Bacteroidetes bacterium]|nr:glycerophosphodiester phosphodiesterase [Bacteroidota bacterium]
KDMMDFANDRNLSILPWTVNEPKEVLRLLHLGVSGIISDFPDRVIAITKGDYTLI